MCFNVARFKVMISSKDGISVGLVDMACPVLCLFRALQLRLCESRCTHDTSLGHTHVNLRCDVNQASGTSPGNMPLLCFSMCGNSRVEAMTVLHDDIGHLIPLHDSAEPAVYPASAAAWFGAASYWDKEFRERRESCWCCLTAPAAV